MSSTAAGRRRTFGFALFVVSIVGSTGFAACASLKSAPDVDGSDGSAAGPSDGTTDAEDTKDARTTPEDATAPDGTTLTDADAGRSRWPSCGAVGSLCSCTSWPFELDSSSCAAADLPSGFCCADPGWPNDSNATCTCGAWTCHTTGSGTCLCGAYEGGTPGSTCSDTFCCAHPVVSTCGCASAQGSACPSLFVDANNIPVTSCTLANQPCPRGGTRVSSCSF